MNIKDVIQYSNWRWWVVLPLVTLQFVILYSLLALTKSVALISNLMNNCFQRLDKKFGSQLMSINGWVNNLK